MKISTLILLLVFLLPPALDAQSKFGKKFGRKLGKRFATAKVDFGSRFSSSSFGKFSDRFDKKFGVRFATPSRRGYSSSSSRLFLNRTILPDNFGDVSYEGKYWVGSHQVKYLADPNKNFPNPVRTTEDVKAFIVWEAVQNNVPPELALEIALRESGFLPWAHSRTTAVGVFQFVKSTWRDTNQRMSRPQYVALNHRYNARLNIEAAIFLMAHGEYYHWDFGTGKFWKPVYAKYFGRIN